MRELTVRRWCLLGALLLLALGSNAPVIAQVSPMPLGSGDDIPPAVPMARETIPQTGGTAQSAAGQAGQRQTQALLAQGARIRPMARINSRIQNRVQLRIRNRIDKYYTPQANATSPFQVASEQARSDQRQ